MLYFPELNIGRCWLLVVDPHPMNFDLSEVKVIIVVSKARLKVAHGFIR
jgi:hypothetical protein